MNERIYRAELVDETIELTSVNGPPASIPLALALAAPEMAEALNDLLSVRGRCDECEGAMEFRCTSCRACAALKKAGVL
jgi:hypothetical protein